MNPFDSIAAQVRRGDRLPIPLALALEACTPAVRIGMWHRARRPRHRVDARVVSFGNITAGGTGKTPAVIERARAEIAQGRRVAVLTRGYAAPSGRRPFDSPNLLDGSPFVVLGDEAALILHKVPRVVVLKDADRVASARRAIESYTCDLLILDDGFQYLALERDENVVMIDATNPFGNGRLIPRGILREPPAALARATHIIVTHADRSPDVVELQSRLRALAPRAPVRLTCHAPVAVRDLNTGERHALGWLRDRRVTLACAIASPRSFVDTAVALGARVATVITRPDHASVASAVRSAPPPVIVTEKDAVRLTAPPPESYALEIELRDFSPA